MLEKAAWRGESYAVMVDTHQKCIIVTHPEIYFKDGNKNFELTTEECPMALSDILNNTQSLWEEPVLLS